MHFLAAASAALCAANGVLFRDPLKPSEPELPQAITLPLISVIVTSVLLNDAWICATPVWIFFFSFLFGDFLAIHPPHPFIFSFPRSNASVPFVSLRLFLSAVLAPEETFCAGVPGNLRYPSTALLPWAPWGWGPLLRCSSYQ